MIKMISMADRVNDRGAIVGLAISSIKTTAIDMGRAASVRVNDRLYNTESEEITLNTAPHPTTPTADDIVESLVIHDIVESIRFERKRSLLAHVRGESMEDCSKAWGIPFHTHKNYIWRSYEEVRKKYARSV
jgi:DNA-directed RNA polymerase specialized sigma24 family protein